MVLLVARAFGANRVGVVARIEEELREAADIDPLLLADGDQRPHFAVVIDLLPYSGCRRRRWLNAGKGCGLDQKEASAKRDCKKTPSP